MGMSQNHLSRTKRANVHISLESSSVRPKVFVKFKLGYYVGLEVQYEYIIM